MCSVSIIVPIYNSEKYLGKCLRSIQNQTFYDFEVIMVDDGSTDMSLSICQDFAHNDSRFHCISTKNNGVSRARNIGLDAASGQYVCFVDSDDEMKSEALSLLYSGMMSDVDLVFAGFESFDEDENPLCPIPERETVILSREEGIELMYKPMYYTYLGYCWSKLFKRDIIISSGLRFDEDIYYNEDRLFTTKYICMQKGQIYFDTIPIYNYYQRSNSAMSKIRGSFNHKFLTDFEAMRRMRRIVCRAFHSKKLNKVSQEKLVDSYKRIIQLMGENDCNVPSIQNKMLIKLLLSLSPGFYLNRINNRISRLS